MKKELKNKKGFFGMDQGAKETMKKLLAILECACLLIWLLFKGMIYKVMKPSK